MNPAYLNELITSLRERGVAFAPGLTDGEIASVQAYYRFRFPPDLRAFLQYALPTSAGFVNWRDYRRDEIAFRVEWPFLGLLRAVEQGYWLRAWGEWPYDPAQALAVARARLHNAPCLIRIYNHRYLPAEPYAPGSPVLSVWGDDIIYYGNTLAEYFVCEFEPSEPPVDAGRVCRPLPRLQTAASARRRVRFWDKIIAGC